MIFRREKSIKENFKAFHEFVYYNKEKIYLSSLVKNGHDVMKFVNLAAQAFPNKMLSVYVYYEILNRSQPSSKNENENDKDTSNHYESTNIFRTLFISAVSSNIEKNLADYIEEKGEIYHPKDPFLLEFSSIKIQVSDIIIEQNFGVDHRTPHLISGGNVSYELIPIKTLICAAFFFRHNRLPNLYRDKVRIPSNLTKMGIKTWKEFHTIELTKQIDLINSLKVKKGSIFDMNIKLLTFEQAHQQDFVTEENTMYLLHDDGLYLLLPRRVSNLNFDQRPIMKRKLTNISDDEIIFFDTEWGWNRDAAEENLDIGSIKYPQFLSFTIIKGAEILKYGADQLDYKKNSGYFKGEDCVVQFLKMLELRYSSPKLKKITCVAHNASNIENHFVLTTIMERLAQAYENYELKLTHVTGTKVHSFRWKNILFLDSQKFISGSLNDISKDLCKNYQKIEISKEKLLSADWLNPSDEMIEYAMYDVYSLAEVWVRFNLGLIDVMFKNDSRPYTFSLTNFRSSASVMKWFLTNDVALDYPYKGEEEEFKNQTKQNPLAWDSSGMVSLRDIIFMGGRTECGYIGTSESFKKENLLVKHKEALGKPYEKEAVKTSFCMSVDITSSYPHCMASKGIPGRFFCSGMYANKTDLVNIINKYNKQDKIVYFYGKVKYKKATNLPLLGIKIDGKLIFPNFMSGMYSVSFWDFEINHIRDNISNDCCMGDYVVFDTYHGLQDKMKNLFDLRQTAIKNGNQGMSYVLKILMNSGYGSMALNSKREVAYLAKGKKIESILAMNSEATVQDAVAGFKWIIVKKYCKTNSLLFAAAYITANARCNLWVEGKRLQEEEGAFLIYRDTDSHKFVDCPSKENYYKNLYGGTKELGKWMYEGSTDSWEIAALKVYRMGSEIRYKGIRGTAKQFLNKAGLIKNSLATVIWTRGRTGVLQTKKVYKNMTFIYSKGVTFLINKGVVTPFNY